MKNSSLTEFINTEIELTDENLVFSLHDAVISQQEQMTYLSALGFEVGKSITVPVHRSDVDQLNDLAEEVTRMIGYNNIPSQVLALKSETDLEY